MKQQADISTTILINGLLKNINPSYRVPAKKFEGNGQALLDVLTPFISMPL